MTPREWTEKTIADLEERKRLKKIGEREAEAFKSEQSFRGWKRYKSSNRRG